MSDEIVKCEDCDQEATYHLCSRHAVRPYRRMEALEGDLERAILEGKSCAQALTAELRALLDFTLCEMFDAKGTYTKRKAQEWNKLAKHALDVLQSIGTPAPASRGRRGGQRAMSILEKIFRKSAADRPTQPRIAEEGLGRYVCVADLWAMVRDAPPTAENVEGFTVCLAALTYSPRAFLEVAFATTGTWDAYHALDEVARLCGPAAQEFAHILLRALSARSVQEER